MATQKQIEAARQNIKKAQKAWRQMSRKQRSAVQPTGKSRSKPGSTGKGDYYHIVVRPKEEFKTFRSHDIGRVGHTIRVSGKRKNGSWATQKWLVSKNDSFIDDQGYLRAKKIRIKLGRF